MTIFYLTYRSPSIVNVEYTNNVKSLGVASIKIWRKYEIHYSLHLTKGFLLCVNMTIKKLHVCVTKIIIIMYFYEEWVMNKEQKEK